MESIAEINNKNRSYYFFNDMINIKNFNPNLLKVDKKSYKSIYIYHIVHIMIKNIGDYESNYSLNPLYLIIGEVDGYIKEKNENKYLVFAFTDKTKEVLKKYTELWDGIKNLIKKINDTPSEYKKDFMKIRFNSDESAFK